MVRIHFPPGESHTNQLVAPGGLPGYRISYARLGPAGDRHVGERTVAARGPDGARVALWVNPNIEFFGIDDMMPSNLNERGAARARRDPNVRNWVVRDYGNRVGIWRIMEVLSSERVSC